MTLGWSLDPVIDTNAKDTADNGILSVVFMSSEGRVPRHMMSRSIMFIVLL